MPQKSPTPWTETSPGIFVCSASDPAPAYSVISTTDLPQLPQNAAENKLHRARICAHLSEAAPIQEMIIALDRKTYVPPHRHDGRSESYHMIEGEVALIIFDDAGTVTDVIFLVSPPAAGNRYLRFHGKSWHSLIPQTEYALFHETAGGPFDRSATEFAAWAPSPDDTAAAARYVNNLQKIVDKFRG